jgi:CRP/FNR family cyclic AMP-dependent transcriptional regulator
MLQRVMGSSLSALIREQLLCLDGVKKYAPTRRATALFSSDGLADSIFFVDSGFVKLLKRSDEGKEVLVSILGPGQIVGEQALLFGGMRTTSAEVMQEGVVYEIPRDVFLQFCDTYPKAWQYLCDELLHRQRELEQKIALLCLHDVEYRILYYLGGLGGMFGAAPSGQEYSLPLSQSELASLVGATRETTSTTLNSLARRGLIKLGRRLLIVTSADAVRSAARERVAKVAQL